MLLMEPKATRGTGLLISDPSPPQAGILTGQGSGALSLQRTPATEWVPTAEAGRAVLVGVAGVQLQAQDLQL